MNSEIPPGLEARNLRNYNIIKRYHLAYMPSDVVPEVALQVAITEDPGSIFLQEKVVPVCESLALCLFCVVSTASLRHVDYIISICECLVSVQNS